MANRSRTKAYLEGTVTQEVMDSNALSADDAGKLNADELAERSRENEQAFNDLITSVDKKDL